MDAFLNEMSWVIVALKCHGSVSYFRLFDFVYREQFSWDCCDTLDQAVFRG